MKFNVVTWGDVIAIGVWASEMGCPSSVSANRHRFILAKNIKNSTCCDQLGKNSRNFESFVDHRGNEAYNLGCLVVKWM